MVNFISPKKHPISLSNNSIVIRIFVSLCSVMSGCTAKMSFTATALEGETSNSTCQILPCSLSLVTEDSVNEFETAPTDILFVLDDSSSMSAIIASIKAGISTINGARFPDNTRMAATYMSPDKVNLDGTTNFGFGYSSVKVVSPGHLQLVSANSINTYLSTEDDGHHRHLALAGCDSEWFSPIDLNPNGQRCLDAALQSTMYSTGVEAGIVSLMQLAEKFTGQNRRLFRNRAHVNVIFISDTHEPGSSYWGKLGAPAKQPSASEVHDAILANSPGIFSIKFSGVLPVPIVGDSRLEGLRVIGATPKNLEEAVVSAENISAAGVQRWWDYSYIPFIKSTNGVIAHPKTEDWSALAEALITDANYTGRVVITTAQVVERVIELKLDDVAMDVGLAAIGADGRTVSIPYKSQTNRKIKISISYAAKIPN